MTPHFLLIAGFADSVFQFRGDLIQSLISHGMTVHVAAPGLSSSPVRLQLEALGVRVHEIPLKRSGTSPASDLWLLWQIFRLIRRTRPGIVLAYTIKPVVFGLIAARWARVPQTYALVTGLGYSFSGSQTRLMSKIVHGLYRFALKRVSGVFFQNPDDEQVFRSLGLIADDVHSNVVNGSGVNLETFSATAVPTSGVRFLMIARLLEAKGIREFVYAARAIRKDDPKVVFRVVGWIDSGPDGIPESELSAWIQEGDVEFLGRLPDVRPAIAESTVFVLPSFYREGTPRTILEAMAMGRAIITTDSPGCRETVVKGQNGFLVRTRSVPDLVDALRSFIDDPKLASKMGARSREIAENKYDVHKVNAQMLREMGLT